MEQNRVVVYAGTRNLYHHMAVAAKSLLTHTKVDRIYFLIEDDEFPEPLPDVIECINVSDQQFFPHDGPNYKCRWTYMTLIRLALPFIFPEEKRVLWLDVDTLVVEDISEIFDTDFEDCFVAAVVEPERSSKPFVYFNAGVLLMDLEKLREGKCQEWIDYINTHKLTFTDQDCINLLCQGKIKPISPIYNSCEWTHEPDDRKIVHYAGDNNWHRRFLFRRYEGAYNERNQSI